VDATLQIWSQRSSWSSGRRYAPRNLRCLEPLGGGLRVCLQVPRQRRRTRGEAQTTKECVRVAPGSFPSAGAFIRAEKGPIVIDYVGALQSAVLCCSIIAWECMRIRKGRSSYGVHSLGRVVIVSATRSTSAVLSVMQLDSSQVLRSSGTLFQVLF
jgi:hypothetical protein